MEDITDDFSRLSLKEITGNKIELLNKIQEQILSAISALNSGGELLSVKKNVQCILQRVIKGLDLIKASCKEEGIVFNCQCKPAIFEESLC